MRKAIGCLLVFGLVMSAPWLMSRRGNKAVSAQASAPTLKRISPDVITAGTATFTIRLTGTNYDDGAKAVVDGTPLDSSRVSRKGKVLLAEIDPSVVANVGTHTVQVINSDHSTSETRILTVVQKDPDIRTRLGGNAAQEGQNVNLLTNMFGEGFNENSTVVLWGFDAPTTFISDTQLSFELDADLLTDFAFIPVVVRNKNSRYSNVEIFFVVPSAAKIDSTDPETLNISNEAVPIKVFGNNFKKDATVVVNGTRLETAHVKERLEATIPASFVSAPSELIVRVEQDGIQSRDTIIAVTPNEDPFVFSVSPTRIRVGEDKSAVDLDGANFTGDVTATIDGQEVGIKRQTRRLLTLSLKSDLLTAPGIHIVQVKNGAGTISNTTSFRVVSDVTVLEVAGNKRDGLNTGCVDAAASFFRWPSRLAFGPDGLLYVTDRLNHSIRSIDFASGQVCTVAGTGFQGYSDSGNPRGFAPTFSNPLGILVDNAGTIYVTENGNDVIRRIRKGAGGAVTVDTFAGLTETITEKARQDKLNSTLVGQEGFGVGNARDAGFRHPDDMVLARDGSIFFSDTNNHSIRRIRDVNGTPQVETIAGNGVPGFADGDALKARFNTPTGLALSNDGRLLYVADTNNMRIRVVNLDTRTVETLSGSGDIGALDGPFFQSSFSQPVGLAVNSDGTIYVSDILAGQIRRVDPNGNVNTITGGTRRKFRDGPGLSAAFNQPRGITLDRAHGFLYVADSENFRIRRITLR